MLLGSLQKGSVDITGAVVDMISVAEQRLDIEWMLRIQNPTMVQPFETGLKVQDQAVEWQNAIRETAQNASVRENQHKEMERTWRIAKEISDLIVYCRTVAFKEQRSLVGSFCDMSSFPETKAEKLMCQQEISFFVKYHRRQFSRIYPKGQRIDSSNYNPMPMWNVGSQMVALNYQTADRPMQLNEAKFRDNGNCGYLLKPKFMFDDNYDPYDQNYALTHLQALTISMRVISGRHLHKQRTGMISPFVKVEIIGAEYDNGVKLSTKTVCKFNYTLEKYHKFLNFT